MGKERSGQRRHFILSGYTETVPYASPQQGRSQRNVPEQDRRTHGLRLLGQLQVVAREEAERVASAAADLSGDDFALQLEFESFPAVDLAFESLARERSGIELLNVRHEENRTYATVFVPEGKLEHFEKLIGDYLGEKRDASGRPQDHARLLNAIREVRRATLTALWTDTASPPAIADDAFWWEVWLPVLGDRQRTINSFLARAAAQGMTMAPGSLSFPERTVLLVFASREQFERSMMTLNTVAELRRAKETAEFFDSQAIENQSAWLEDLLARVRLPRAGSAVPHVCLLDTGVNRGHPLLGPGLAEVDLHTVEPGWGADDSHGHGTGMAGLALVGDLVELLAGSDPVEVRHRLESVKLLPFDGANGGDARHHGYLTIEAVARPEIVAPRRQRVFGMAVTARDNRDRGRPSAWSATIDRLAADVDGFGAQPRLLVVSAGNITDPDAWACYPASNETDGVHDPAQAWNALTVGAYTALDTITDPDAAAYAPIAPKGGLSPFSTTSRTWSKDWPLKPDVLFEGGNAAKDSISAVPMPDLSLLTTHHRPSDRLFCTSNATSAATAQASRMAAQVMAEYPELWPEAVRGLIVHSAEWTDTMRQMFLPAAKRPSKEDYRNLVRCCGFGVPMLDRALWTVSNSLTLIAQQTLRPFQKSGGKQPKLRDMHLHHLPWPREALGDLGATIVEMRVTLSYFIEPNPSERGVRSRYRYASHGLRFDVKRASESEPAFRARVNAAARDEEEGTDSSAGDAEWQLGPRSRHLGSLHSDIWRGTAADLASREVLGVYPALGWWKTRPPLQRFDRDARYALLVSIHAPGVDVDLCAEVASLVDVAVVTEV